MQQLKNYFWHLPLGWLYQFLYRFPSKKLTLIGVTGTDGKTTVVHLIHHLLSQAGIPCGIISTITSPGLHTTSPDPQIVQHYLSSLAKKAYTHAVLEVTSHALDQFRFVGCRFKIGILTNITHEHLDYHHSYQRYLRAKARLFGQSDIAILNQDDSSCPFLSANFPRNISYSVKKSSNYQAKNIHLKSSTLSFAVNGQKIVTDSPYHYQVYNILPAYIACLKLGLKAEFIARQLIHFPLIPGRRQQFKNTLGFQTIIDFAHTPNALKETLSSLRLQTKGNLIVIFGATGGRDQSKRPLMGRVVSQIADIAIITADDTRHEKIADINQHIINGLDPSQRHFKYYNIPNRQDAFNLAVKLAKKGDTIIACGKGHETTILHGLTEYPWSEADAFRTAINAKIHV
jgi:UDP-N-acetylmuramoyl-L-alanyl-D-glutamate--2,6-diaminopimelate ligase